MSVTQKFDVIIIGGSYAGLSAAMALGRSMKKVLIIDAGKPCNRQTPHSHNFLTQDGSRPDEIADISRKQVLKYATITLLQATAIKGSKTPSGFIVTTEDGNLWESRKLIVASGIKDLMPDIPGFADCWGISVVHCPYCHGYELRNKKTAVIANGERAFHIAQLVNNLTDKITIITSGKAEFDEEKIGNLSNKKITITEKEVAAIEHRNGQIFAIQFHDGTKEDFDAAYAAIPFRQHADIAASLGCELTEDGYIKIDPFQETSVAGVYACGDNCSRMRSVANAVAGGNLTGAMVNSKLTIEKF